MSIFFRKIKKENSNDLIKTNIKSSSKSSKGKKMPKQAKKTIDSLSNIILINILGNILSDEYHENITEYRLVCKLWSDIICKSVSIRINFGRQPILSPRSTNGSKKDKDNNQLQATIPLGFYYVQRTIVKFQKITYLSFRNNRSLDVDLLLDLFSATGSHKKFSESLLHLDIGKMELERRDPKMALLNRVLLNFPNLMALDISENEISSSSISLFIDNLKNSNNHQQLNYLNLSLNPIGDDGSLILGNNLFSDNNNTTIEIRYLNLIGCGLQEDSLKNLFLNSNSNKLYKKVNHLHSLLLGHNGMLFGGEESSIIINKILLLNKDSNLKYLDLEYCNLKTSGFNKISNSLLENNQLLYLDLTNNQLELNQEIKEFEEQIEKKQKTTITLKVLLTSMNKWSYSKIESRSDWVQLPILCQKQYDFRFLLIDCIKSIKEKGYYCYFPLKGASMTLPKSE